MDLFQHTAARRRLGGTVCARFSQSMFQHTAARRRLGAQAAYTPAAPYRFNTQPPEGGWQTNRPPRIPDNGFNTQPPEGDWMPTMWRCWRAVSFQHTAA